jgi:hypothetical protein
MFQGTKTLHPILLVYDLSQTWKDVALVVVVVVLSVDICRVMRFGCLGLPQW